MTGPRIALAGLQRRRLCRISRLDAQSGRGRAARITIDIDAAALPHATRTLSRLYYILTVRGLVRMAKS